jgi:hypothetical protein
MNLLAHYPKIGCVSVLFVPTEEVLCFGDICNGQDGTVLLPCLVNIEGLYGIECQQRADPRSQIIIRDLRVEIADEELHWIAVLVRSSSVLCLGPSLVPR